MKRFAALVLTLVLCLGLFSACGSEANYNVADVAGAIEGVATIDNPTDFTDDDLTLDMSLDMEATVEEYAGQRTKTNGAPGAVLVVKAKAGQADTWPRPNGRTPCCFCAAWCSIPGARCGCSP